MKVFYAFCQDTSNGCIKVLNDRKICLMTFVDRAAPEVEKHSERI